MNILKTLAILALFVPGAALAQTLTLITAPVDATSTGVPGAEPVLFDGEPKEEDTSKAEIEFVETGGGDQEGSSGGNIETEFKVEEGEKADPEHDPGVMIMEAETAAEREMKESGEKGGTEDINIGVGELQETGPAGEEIIADEQGSAAPDSFFDIFVDLGDEDTRAAVDAFIKLGDIKGESMDEAMEHDDEMEIGDSQETETAAKTSKPKEIVVVGSKVRQVLEESEVEIRGWDPANKEVTIGPDDINEEEDFLDFIGATTASDENIEEVSFYFNKIEMKYDQPAKLLGLFNIEMTAKTEINEAGEVKVKFPWYRFLTSNNVAELRTQVESEVSAHELGHALGDEQTNLDFLRERASMFQTLSNVMKDAHDTAMASIRNTK